MPEPICSFTLTRYPPSQAFWALSAMGKDRSPLRKVPGLRFFRLLGTGRGADLTLGADLRRWAMFGVWESREALEEYQDSALRRSHRDRAEESYTAVLRPLRWRGRWGGVDPFAGVAAGEASGRPIASVTRARIRPRHLRAFWANVPDASRGLHANPGLLASVGVGEVPLLHQATFTLWRDAASLRDYAYRGEGHREAISRSGKQGWFAEELFARFEVLGSGGLWDGRDPLR